MDTNATTEPVAPSMPGPPPAAEKVESVAHSAPDFVDPANVAAARRALLRAKLVTYTVAVSATVLSAQGMILVGRDILGLPLWFAVGFSCFLEIAMIAAGLWDQHEAIRGRATRGIFVWVFAVASGCMSALHEVIEGTIGNSTWNVEPASILGVVLRIIVPLVAAWLWHRALIGERDASVGITYAEAQRRKAAAKAALKAERTEDLITKRLHKLARASNNVRRLEHWLKSQEAKNRPTFIVQAKIDRAKARKDRVHDKLFEVFPADHPDYATRVESWHRAMASADVLAQLTDVAPEEGAVSVSSVMKTPSAPKARRTTARQVPPSAKPAAAATAAATSSPAPKPVAAPANVRQLTARASSGGSDRDRAQELFDKIVADPGHEGWGRDGKPSAKYIHDDLGLTHDDATTRRWVGKMWKTFQELQELPPSTPSPDDIDQLVTDTTPATHIQQAKEA